MRKLLLLLLCSLIIASSADMSAAKPKRTSKSVKKERRMTANEVERTRKQISHNTAETRRQLNRLQSLTAETHRCEKSIGELNQRISTLNRRIKEMDDSILTMQNRLSTLREAYATNLRDMRARRQMMSESAIIFSSRTFTEAYRRYRYLREFERWQREKTLQIKHLTTELSTRRKNVAEARSRQSEALASLSKEKDRLNENLNETEKTVSDLRRQGSTLKKVLDEKQQQLKSLDDELDRIIAEEARRAEEARKAEEERLAKEAKRKAEEARLAAEEKKKQELASKDNNQDKPKDKIQPVKKTNDTSNDQAKQEKPVPASTPAVPSQNELIALSGTFEANKGKMPAPVTGKYSIVSHFGLNSHPDITNIKINNSGIDIETTTGASARAVFDGEVSSVFRVSGYQNVVMLRHGNYLTVYAGIDGLHVKKGDKVKAGQSLGTIYADEDDNSRCVLHFEVRRERAKLNPEEWIK